MSRPKKKTVVDGLTLVEKKYIDVMLRTSNNINYDQLFKKLSVELDKPEQLIRDYSDKLDIPVVDQQLPPEPTPKVLLPRQEMARDLLTPNRKTEDNKARHISVMSDAASEAIQNMPTLPLKGGSKFRDNIYRQ